MKDEKPGPAERKIEEKVASKRSEVLIAVAILVLIVVLIIVAYKIWGDDCKNEPATSAGNELTSKKLRMKDRYRAGVKENVKAAGMGSQAYDDERLSEFHVGSGRSIAVVDYGRKLESANANVFGWFRIPPSDSIIHLFEKMGHTQPRTEGLDLELKPGQKIFQLMLLRERLTLHLFNAAGTVAQTISVMNENLRDGQWHQIGFSIDTRKGVCIFVDGVQLVHQRSSSGLVTDVHPAVFTVGQSSDAKFFASNVTYSTVGLDKIQASSIYNNGIPQDPTLLIPKLRMWLPLQDRLVYDSIGNMEATTKTGPKRAEKSNGVQERGKFVKKVTPPNTFVY